MSQRRSLTATMLLGATCVLGAGAATTADLQRQFSRTIRPFVSTYCATCHGGREPMAQLDLRAYSSMSQVVRDYPRWMQVLEKLSAGQMPPEGTQQPPADARQAVIQWIEAVRANEARKNAGDPGVVLARRLNNAEYNYTIRDLTGVDLRPAREFPVDPANPAGFDNSGESLAMTPSLLAKYLQAAREVSNHLVLKPDGIAFAPHPMLAETDRDKYCVKQIIDVYQRYSTDYRDYFLAAWQYKHRAALGKPRTTLSGFAAAASGEKKISTTYLLTVWRSLEESREEVGPLARLQAMWRDLPPPGPHQPDAAAGAARMRDFVVELRKKIEFRYTKPLSVRGISTSGQPFLMWRNRQYAANRMDYDRSMLQVEGEYTPPRAAVEARSPQPQSDAEVTVAVAARRLPPDPDLHVPAGQRERYEASFSRFAALFPDSFYVSERGRYFPDNTRDKGRFLSAGFHNLMGYFRDDIPFYRLILDGKEQKQLDALWQELDFIASANIRTYIQFYLSESGEAREQSGTVRSGAEDKEITSEERIREVAGKYLAKARAANNELAAQAISEHFEWVNAGIRWVEKARLDAEARHRKALEEFAARAYRRPLSRTERDDLVAFYRSLRDKNGLDHEDAMRDSIVGILMSPDFCYRVDLLPEPAIRRAAATGTQPLTNHALASRLSYFLWASKPDDELLARAAAGHLREPQVLTAQVRRMLKDSRARALATEFGGNWLDFRRFEEHNAVDRERFPEFTNELRVAMFEEPVQFLMDLIRNDRPVLDLLYARHTFVNSVLAKHYGIQGVKAGPNDWVRVNDARQYGRGGLLPMSVFLTQNAPGLRTSPVKRGYWVVRRVLGETIPPPPAAVPELPRDEAKMDLPLRDALARHREDKTCSGCHARFDSLGLALEGYGPVGETRSKDLAGRPVDVRAAFPGGGEGAGIEGLRAYIRQRRERDFIDNLCRKMLVYALGRTLMLSDEPAIEKMRARLAASGYRFSSLVESIVTSPLFLSRRAPVPAPAAQGTLTAKR